MEQRRIQLRMKWREVATAAGLSIAGLGAIRRGERQPSALARARIEDALQWAPGSVDRILAGKAPVPASSADPDELRRLIAEAEDELRWLDPKYESTRKIIAARLQAEIDALRAQLKAMVESDTPQ